MALTVIELPTEMVRVDLGRFPDLDTTLIPEHLTYYCSKFDPLPAVVVRVSAEGVFVVEGQKYVGAAMALRRPKLRAVVDPSSDEKGISRLLAMEGVQRLDWKAIEQEEARNPVPLAWHILFFAQPLTREQRQTFSTAIVSLMPSRSDPDLNIGYDESGKRAEVRLPTPVFDHDWARDLLRVLSDFHHAHVPIVSYQGRAFSP